MADIRKASDYLAACLKEQGIDCAIWVTSASEKREFTAEEGEFTLYRTLYDSSFSLTVYKDGRRGTCSGNDLSEASLSAAVLEASSSADAAPQDPANGIAPFAGQEVFRYGTYDCDEEQLFARALEFTSDIAKEYKYILLMHTILEHDAIHSLYRNSNGTEFETFKGHYSVGAELAGNDGERSTGLDYCSFITDRLDKPFLACGSIREHLRSAEAQLREVPLQGKFTGTVIFTPDCVGNLVEFISGSFLDGHVLLEGTGLWNDKIGQQVADSRITLTCSVDDPRTVVRSGYTRDGFRRQNVTLIDHGVLKSHSLDLYTANKTGRTPDCGGVATILEPGTDELNRLIAGVERGLLVGGFSGGTPGANGELSGVAKNAFLIENGQIRGAVTETMLSGNLADMLMNLRGITAEAVEDGRHVLPYLAIGGITVSGKGE